MPVKISAKKLKNEVYSHIYNKAVENRNLFNDEQDYEVFLSYLKDYLTPPLKAESVKKVFTVNGRTFRGVPHQPKNYFQKVDLIAYNLMPDHFHLLFCQLSKGAIEKLIRSLCTRYAIYYNKKYQRHGSLLTGPYQSIKIKNLSQLLWLTHYLHQEATGYSSYQEYLGERKSSWIKPQNVLAHFEKLEKDYFKGITSYKNFVEEYELKQNEKNLLEGIIFESKPKHLERRVLNPEKNDSFQDMVNKPVPEPRLKISGFLATVSTIFVVLVILGMKNIQNSQAQTKNIISSTKPSPTSQVSGIKDVQPEPKKILVIKINDESESVNIRKEPTTKSEIITKVKDGETFELISQDSEWYQIKLDDGEIAFVSAKYAEIISSN